MKTIFSLQTGIATLLCTAALAGLMACDAAGRETSRQGTVGEYLWKVA